MNLQMWLITFVLGCVLVKATVSAHGECKTTDLRGSRRGSITWTSPSDYDTHCHKWMLSAATPSTMTISVSSMDLDASRNCERSYVSVGPNTRFCQLENDIPLVYIANETTTYMVVEVTYEYILPQSFSLSYMITPADGTQQCETNDFHCIDDDKCIIADWHCNGASECRDGSDEMPCREATTAATRPPTTTPRPVQPTTTPPSRTSLPTTHTPRRTSHPGDHNLCGTVFNIVPNSTYGHISSRPIHTGGTLCQYEVRSLPHTTIQLRIDWFNLTGDSYVRVYEGDPSESREIGSCSATQSPPRIIEANSEMKIYFSHMGNMAQGFSATYQRKGFCIPNLQFTCNTETDCYTRSQKCDGVWDCPHYGRDEMGCGVCGKDRYSCSRGTSSCYSLLDRCNGQAHCKSHLTDELNCTDQQCGSHNGTYLCHDGRCIPENWLCDGTRDCPLGDDESSCPLSRKVTIAAIIGSLTCSLLLVIALGCTYKLHLLHTQHRGGRSHRRYVSPVTAVQEEIMASRSAPPPYLEAMRTSRSFDEVQREFLRVHAAMLEANPTAAGDSENSNARTRPQGHEDGNPVNDAESSRDTEALSSEDEEVDVDDDDVPLIDTSPWVSDETLIDITVVSTPPDQHPANPTSNVRISTTSGQELAQWCRRVPKPEPTTDLSPAGDGEPAPEGAASPCLSMKTGNENKIVDTVTALSGHHADTDSEGLSVCSAESIGLDGMSLSVDVTLEDG